mmetsp:Transcript_4453/g.10674  ORF Transcript_4453/g.10674 Transcript_4453/m.10674 type:complete len:298 (+) Transcript_4453:719-1612(+)
MASKAGANSSVRSVSWFSASSSAVSGFSEAMASLAESARKSICIARTMARGFAAPFSACSKRRASSSWRRFTCSGPRPNDNKSLSSSSSSGVSFVSSALASAATVFSINPGAATSRAAFACSERRSSLKARARRRRQASSLAFRSSGVSCVGCTALVASGAGAGWLASASCGCVAACGVSVFGACASLSGGIGSSPSLAPYSLISDSAPAVTAAAANGTLAAASGAEADGSAAPATATLDAAGKEALEPDLGACMSAIMVFTSLIMATAIRSVSTFSTFATSSRKPRAWCNVRVLKS